MIERIPFGRTGHHSTRILFGAAALGSMRQERADAVLEQRLVAGVNPIDTAASYGDAEIRLAPFLKRHRDGISQRFPLLALGRTQDRRRQPSRSRTALRALRKSEFGRCGHHVARHSR